MLEFLTVFLRCLAFLLVMIMIWMAFAFWFRRNSRSKLALLLKEKLWFLPKAFWPRPKGQANEGQRYNNQVQRVLGVRRQLDPQESLKTIEAGEAFEYDFAHHTVLGRISGGRMEQRVQGNNQPWTLVGAMDYQLVLVDNDECFAFFPLGERGKPEWFFLKEGDASGLWEFFRGTKEAPGPARKFGASNQTARVAFTRFGREWVIADIGQNAYRVESGEGLCMSGTGRFAHLVAKATDESGLVMLFTHLEEGVGYDSVWIGRAVVASFFAETL